MKKGDKVITPEGTGTISEIEKAKILVWLDSDKYWPQLEYIL